jgi:hypothetical protein
MTDTTDPTLPEDSPLDARIHDEMVVDIPDDVQLVDAIGGAVEIVRDTWTLRLTDAMGARDRQDQVFTYLLAAYAANVVSDGERPPTVTRTELYDLFGAEATREIAWHGWVRTYDDYAEIRPESLSAVAAELTRRYGGDDA